MDELFTSIFMPILVVLGVFLVAVVLFIVLLSRSDTKQRIKDSTAPIESDPLTQRVIDMAKGMHPTYAVVTPEGVEFFSSQRVLAIKGDGANAFRYVLPHGQHMFELCELSKNDLWDRIESDDGSPSVRISFSEEGHANLNAKCAHVYKENTVSQVSFFAKHLAAMLGGYRVFVLRDMTGDEVDPGTGRITGATIRDNGVVDVSYDTGSGGGHHQEDICAFIAREDVAGLVPDPKGYMAGIAPELIRRKVDRTSWGGATVRDPYVAGKKIIWDL